MNIINKAYCRVFQLVFRAAMPFLPYREPKIIDHVCEVPLLLKTKKLSSVMLVTDTDLRNAGVTKPLEDTLAENGITCTVYDGTSPNPTVHNVIEALVHDERFYAHSA